MNHCSLQKGIPYDSFSWENALGPREAVACMRKSNKNLGYLPIGGGHPSELALEVGSLAWEGWALWKEEVH